MKKRTVFWLWMLAVLGTACVYDYQAETGNLQRFVVIEGDILIGDYTQVRVSTSGALSDNSAADRSIAAVAYVEASDATRYTGPLDAIDTRNANPSLQYRLVVSCIHGTYMSDWVGVLLSGPIDSVGYHISDDRQTLTMEVSSRGVDSPYFRWLARETWEYHTPYYASSYFVRKGTEDHGVVYPQDTILPFRSGENTCYCWNDANVPDIMTASTEHLSENRLVQHELYTIGCYEQRISYIYSVEILQEALSEEAYRYWETLSKNSKDIGGLFSPEPFEMPGNIHSERDPEEKVLGYISATVPSVKRVYLRSAEIKFAQIPPEDRQVYDIESRCDYGDSKTRRWLFTNGFSVVGRTPGMPGCFDWLPTRCVNCEVWGNGTRKKPDFWPYDD